MAKQLLYKVCMVSGDTVIKHIDNYYNLKNTRTVGEEVFVFEKNKTMPAYGEGTPEELILDDATLAQLQSLYDSVRAVVLSTITVPEDSIFVLKSMRAENTIVGTPEDEGQVNRVEAYYCFELEGLQLEKSLILNEFLSQELKDAIQVLFDIGKQKISVKEEIE